MDTQFHAKIKCFRSDNVKEFCEGALQVFFQKQGISHQRSCAYTPQQNGVVERKHRHLLETARALSIQSKVPLKFWGDCILCAVYIINRMPLKVLGDHSPYFKLYQQQPVLDHLKTFGCLCYIATPKPHRTKFDVRAKPGVFLGYDIHHKGYKVLDIAAQTISISRDVVFHEKHFPYLFQSNTDIDSFPSSIYLPSVTPVHQTCFTDDIPQPSVNPNPIPSSSDASNVVDLSQNIPPDPVPTRKSTRNHQVPTYLQDYYCNMSTDHPDTSEQTSDTSEHTAHWCNLVKFDTLPVSSKSLISQYCDIQEPSSYEEASHNKLWVEDMNKEIQALHRNDTWELVDLPKGKKAIGSKWVYKVKLKSDGSLERCKARLVAKGYNQRYGVDYEETFSPVVKMSTIRCILAIAAKNKWPLHQLDVNNAFLHGDLTEEVYMKVPQGIDNPDNKVCRLKKSIYGLKQASRQWFAKLVSALIAQGFIQSKNDYSMFIKKTDSGMCIATVYVDDVILTGTDQLAIANLKSFLHQEFSIKDLGNLSFFLGIEVSHLPTGLFLSQKKFTKELLADCPFDLTKPASTPLPLNVKLNTDDGDLLSDPETYRSLVGKLNFLTNTRPDLAFAVQSLSQFMQQPRTPHLVALLHTLRYVSHLVGQGILLNATSDIKLQAFTDSDWAACPNTRKSVTGYVTWPVSCRLEI